MSMEHSAGADNNEFQLNGSRTPKYTNGRGQDHDSQMNGVSDGSSSSLLNHSDATSSLHWATAEAATSALARPPPATPTSTSSHSSSLVSISAPPAAAHPNISPPAHGYVSTPTSQPGAVITSSDVNRLTCLLRDVLSSNAASAARIQQSQVASSQLHALSFFLHAASAERSQRLAREYEHIRHSIARGTQLLSSMSTVLERHEGCLGELGAEVEVATEAAQRAANRAEEVGQRLEETEAEVTRAMAVFEERLAKQQLEFRKQEAQLARLLAVRFKMDFALDLAVAGVAWYGSHNAITSTFLSLFSHRIISRFLVRAPNGGGRRARNRRADFVTTLGQLLLFLYLMRRIRALMTQMGLHHAIGSYTKYAEFIGKTFVSMFDMIRGGASEAAKLQDDGEDENMHVHAQVASPNKQIQNEESHAAVSSPEKHRNDTMSPLSPASISSSAATSSSSSALASAITPLAPDFSTSAAASLGRSIGRGVLTLVRTGRDALKMGLDKVVATGAAVDEEDAGTVGDVEAAEGKHMVHADNHDGSTPNAAASSSNNSSTPASMSYPHSFSPYAPSSSHARSQTSPAPLGHMDFTTPAKSTSTSSSYGTNRDHRDHHDQDQPRAALISPSTGHLRILATPTAPGLEDMGQPA